MEAREAIVHKDYSETAIKHWSKQQLNRMLDTANIIEIKDDDYRSVSLPCRPFTEKLH